MNKLLLYIGILIGLLAFQKMEGQEYTFETLGLTTTVATLKTAENTTHVIIADNVKKDWITATVYSIGKLAANENIKSITLGKNIGKKISYGFLQSKTGKIDPEAFAGLTGLEEFRIGENTYYNVTDSVLFNKDKTEMLFYPAAKPATEFTLPITVRTIASGVKINKNLTSLKIGGPKPTLAGTGTFNPNLKNNCTLYVPSILLESYTIDPNWKNAFKEIRAFDISSLYEEITLTEAGQLATILGNNKLTLTHLKINGPLNGTDFACLRDMTRSKTKGNLAYLDLTNATIVAGGNKYIFLDETLTLEFGYQKEYSTENGLFPHCAFYKCDILTALVLPTNIKEIGYSALRECDNLTEVRMAHSTFTKIHRNAFRISPKISSFTLPASLQEIGNDAFVQTTANKKFNVSNENGAFTSINGVLFTKDKKELVSFPLGHTTTEYTIPIGTEKIRSCAFSFTTLQTLKMPYGLHSIEEWAFEHSSFTTMTLPSTLTVIKKAVFSNCGTIKNLYIHNPVPPQITATDQGLNTDNCTLYVPYKKGEIYRDNTYWGKFQIIKELSDVIYVYKPESTLQQTLEERKIQVDTLTTIMIHGELDSDDIKYLRMLAGVDDTGEENSMNILKNINLGEARIIDGGSAYLIKDGIEYVSSANDMGQYAFANTNIETFRFPASIDTVHLNTFENSTDLNCIAFNSLPSNITDATEAKQLLPESQENGIIVINNHTGGSRTANVIIANDQNSFVKLTDKKNYALNEKLSLASCSFTKVFSKETKKNESKGWETLILPFKPTEIRGFNKRKAEVFLVPFGSDRTPFEDKGLRVLNFWLHELTPEGFKAVKFEDIKAYTPYIISMPNNSDDYGDTYNIEGPVEFIANAVGNTKVELNETIQPETTTGNQFDMSATFRKMTGNADVYVLNKEGSSFDIITSFDDRTAEDYRVDAFEAYVIAHPAFKGTKSFRIDGRPSIPSDIEQIMMNTDENKKELQIMTDPNGLRIRSKSDRSLQVYTMDGRIATDVYLYEGDNYISLPKGIYVIEREKAVVY